MRGIQQWLATLTSTKPQQSMCLIVGIWGVHNYFDRTFMNLIWRESAQCLLSYSMSKIPGALITPMGTPIRPWWANDPDVAHLQVKMIPMNFFNWEWIGPEFQRPQSFGRPDELKDRWRETIPYSQFYFQRGQGTKNKDQMLKICRHYTIWKIKISKTPSYL